MQNSNWEDANCIACMVKYMYIYGIYVCENGYMSFLFGELNKKKTQARKQTHSQACCTDRYENLLFQAIHTHTIHKPEKETHKHKTNKKSTKSVQQ